jgi:hypothetical protein
VKVDVLLADKGTSNPQAGTLNLLNVGWILTHLVPGPQPLTPPHAVAVFYEVKLHRCNKPVQMYGGYRSYSSRPIEGETC